MLDSHAISRLSLSQKQELLALLEAKAKVRSENRIREYYPEAGPLRRELYPRHMEFFEAGGKYRERCFMAGNRVGKTEGAGGYETTLHLTGEYPNWWKGRRFDRPVRWLAAGKTNETTRDIVQTKLLGAKHARGTGLIPKAAIGEVKPRAGVPDAVDTVYIRHVSSGWSQLMLKSYQQGRDAVEGFELDGAWLDEEPPLDFYSEVLIRTMTTGGPVYITFTPLAGMSDVVMSFLPRESQLSA